MLKLNVVLSETLRLLNEYNGKPIDSFIVFREMAMDIVTSFSFGLKNYDSLLKDPFGKSVDLLKDFETQASTGFWITQMPLFSSLTNSQNVKEASSRCLNWVENQFNLSLSNLKSINDGSLMTVYFEENSSGGNHIKKPGLFDTVHAKSEIYDVIAAGHVTAAVMLSYVCYELAAHPQIQEKVREELYQQLRYDSSIFCTDFTPFDYKLVDKEETLPYFHAVINETFRVNTPGPGQQPRVVPESGLIWRGSQNVSPFKIPGGTVVVTQSWSLHRAKNVFPNPYKFIPERWMNIPNSQLRFLKSHLHHFGSGARGCMGMNLANAEIKMMLSSLICRYRIELVAGVDYVHDAEMIDAYVSAPKSGRMVLKFTNIN